MHHWCVNGKCVNGILFKSRRLVGEIFYFLLDFTGYWPAVNMNILNI